MDKQIISLEVFVNQSCAYDYEFIFTYCLDIGYVHFSNYFNHFKFLNIYIYIYNDDNDNTENYIYKFYETIVFMKVIKQFVSGIYMVSKRSIQYLFLGIDLYLLLKLKKMLLIHEVYLMSPILSRRHKSAQNMIISRICMDFLQRNKIICFLWKP